MNHKAYFWYSEQQQQWYCTLSREIGKQMEEQHWVIMRLIDVETNTWNSIVWVSIEESSAKIKVIIDEANQQEELARQYELDDSYRLPNIDGWNLSV